MSAATLTVELLTEELPPKALKQLGEAFAAGILDGLRNRGFLQAASTAAPYATPRRLAVRITHVLAVSPDQPFTQKLMPASVALDAGDRPTAALRKRLAGLGRAQLADLWPDAVDGADRLLREFDGKADAVFLHSIARGGALHVALQGALDDALAALPIPKVMTYQRADGATVKFVRPAHRLLALHGADIVPVTALGLEAGRTTDGHRFLGRRGIEVATADAYEETLAAEGKVIARFDERRARIVAGLAVAAAGCGVAGAQPIMPDALLDEVSALVEWPAVYAGSFDPAFLAVPPECLILTMQQNQKYFALAGGDGALANRFLVVSNIETAAPAAIVEGNERVLRARLADARFFFDQDRRTRLDARVPRLAAVVYHNLLGTQLERVERVRGARDGAGAGDRRRSGAGRARRVPGQGRSGHRHGRRVPRAAGHHGPLLRGARRRERRGRRRRSSSTTGRASPATRCRRRRWRRRWRWPTSWRRSPACSASARCPAATGIPTACGATRSA